MVDERLDISQLLFVLDHQLEEVSLAEWLLKDAQRRISVKCVTYLGNLVARLVCINVVAIGTTTGSLTRSHFSVYFLTDQFD